MVEIKKESFETLIAKPTIGNFSHEIWNILDGNIQWIIDSFDIPEDKKFLDISKSLGISNPISRYNRVGATIILVWKSKKQLSKSTAQKIIWKWFGKISATANEGYIELEYNIDSVSPKDLLHLVEKRIWKTHKCLLIKYWRPETLETFFRGKHQTFRTFHEIEKK